MASKSEIRTYGELLELTPVIEDPRAHTKEPQGKGRSSSRWSRGFLAWVVLPTVLGAILFGFVFADRYEAESRFVIRSSNRALASTLANLLQNSGMVRASDDAYAVREYMLSRDAMMQLVTRHRLREAWARPSLDFFWRFPNIYTPSGEEGLYRHYQRLVSVKYDPTSGVSILRVEAFDPKEAQELAQGLIEAAESLVNRLNDRAASDAWSLAKKEVGESEARTRAAQAAITAFRSREALIDPTMVSVGTLETIARLSMDVADTNIQLMELQRSSPQSTQLATLRTRLAAIEEQIKQERLKLAGDEKSLSTRISEYEQLALSQEFAEKALVRALASLDAARLDAQRQQIYLERVAEPQVSDYPAYPYRALSIAALFLLCVLLYRVAMIFANDARLHVRG